MVDVEVDWIGIIGDFFVDFFFCGCVLVVVFQQCVGMDVDVVGNDYFQVGQVDVGVGQLVEVECMFWVGYVYYDFQWCRWYVVQVCGGVFVVEFVFVDEVGIVFSVVDGDFLVIGDDLGGVV